jgi:hypothetical protein
MIGRRKGDFVPFDGAGFEQWSSRTNVMPSYPLDHTATLSLFSRNKINLIKIIKLLKKKRQDCNFLVMK